MWHFQGKGALQETAHIFVVASKLQKALQFYRLPDMENKTEKKRVKGFFFTCSSEKMQLLAHVTF